MGRVKFNLLFQEPQQESEQRGEKSNQAYDFLFYIYSIEAYYLLSKYSSIANAVLSPSLSLSL